MPAKPFDLFPASPDLADRVAGLIPDLIRSTGPVSYDYQFGPGDLLARAVAASWRTPGTLFSAACATLAVDAGGALAGLELGFAGPDFYTFRNRLAGMAADMVARGEATVEELTGLAERAGLASYLNAHIPDDVYYLHALATTESHRGLGAGRALLEAAIGRASAAGYRELQLDVLADNPAVDFYRAMGLDVLAEARSPRLTRDHGFPAEYRMAVTL